MMKHMLAFAWGWVVVLSTTMVFGVQPLAPSAVFTQSSFQFESALEGQAVEHDFLVQNKGGADLQIEKIKTG
jgi:hypothetical protein